MRGCVNKTDRDGDTLFRRAGAQKTSPLVARAGQDKKVPYQLKVNTLAFCKVACTLFYFSFFRCDYFIPKFDFPPLANAVAKISFF